MPITTLSPVEYIGEVADRFASREVDTLHDVWAVGSLVHTGEITYDAARDAMSAAFAERGLSASTAKVYVSQGYGLAQLFDTFDDVEAFADDECNGSRSLKRIYDATRVRPAKVEDSATVEGETEGEGEGSATTDADRAAAIVAILSAMSDPTALATVADALNARIGVTLKAA
jgi:hypothetical protein